MTSVVISQPMLFPWPGFFEQMMVADVYLFLDDVQFSKGSFTNRIQLRVGDVSKWMTIPLAGKGSFQNISNLRDTGAPWRETHLSLLRQSLRGAPYAADAISIVESCFAEPTLCDVLIASIERPASYLGLGSRQRRGRTSTMDASGGSWQRVLDLVCSVDGTRYVTGHGAAQYLDHEAFAARGVAVDYMVYSKKPWPKSGGTFSPFVSILDLIAHTGPAAASYLEPATEPWQTFVARAQSKNPSEREN